ncbi:MAG: hypothetical protein E6Q24_02370 [Chitinophagaceae bacterium]|jgi:hypothetical protein|nr:hypothetical protein [Sphingobacteriales bacterium]OJW03658.1 MAG: hypothetical protein BGO52_15885 [Sphingobacteriales bacterium 44-61]TXJ29263.1 MAG: hypothetical protein E6Q24_02370 [Chitinophagaceae bacterium]
MVQVETSQLTAECNAWRDALRQYRDEFSREKSELQQICSHQLSKDQLQEVEHLHNQLHIQLINIHDLRHAIKSHARQIDFEMNVNSGHLREETLAAHEMLFDQYQSLDLTLHDLRHEFNHFLSVTTTS